MYRFNPSWHARVLRGSADAPDNSGVNAAALANADISKDALAFYKQQYADSAPQRAQTQDLANKQSQAQVDASSTATQQAKDTYADYKSTFQPVEQKLATDAQNYDTQGRRVDAANSAVADVDRAFSATQASNQRMQARAGIAPGSAKSLALQSDAALGATTAQAGAATQAGRYVEGQGVARMSDVANLGRNIASSQATQQSIASGNSNSAVAASNAALGAQQSGAALMNQGYQTAASANNSSGNLFSQAANSTNAANSNNTATNTAAIAGLGMVAAKVAPLIFAASDENIKTNVRSISGKTMLDNIEKLPIKRWMYSPEKGGPDDGGTEHVGPMAQEVRAKMGEAAAPGGKVINVVSMLGNLTGGIQEIAKRVKHLEKEKA